MDEATSIQIAFPSEPSWSEVSDATLIQLVETHNCEPSCAQSAMTELRNRSHPETERLCHHLLSSQTADKWLRAGALGNLLSFNPLGGLDVALDLVGKCEIELLEEVIEALNYEHEGPLSAAVHQHPIVPRVRARLGQLGGNRAAFGKLFVQNFGASEPAA